MRRRGARPRRGHRLHHPVPRRGRALPWMHRRCVGRRRRDRRRRRRPSSRRACSDAAPRRSRDLGRRRSPLVVVIGASVVWPGLDAQETPEVDTAVWALQTGDGRRYARVNTAVGELDTVRSISNPDKVVAVRRCRVPVQRQPQQGHADRRGPTRPTSTSRRCAHRSRRPPARPTSSPPATTSPTAPTPAPSSPDCSTAVPPRSSIRSRQRRERPRSTPPTRSRSTIAACSSATRGPTARSCATTSARRPCAVATRSTWARAVDAGHHRRGRHVGGRRHRRRRRLAARGGCRHPRAHDRRRRRRRARPRRQRTSTWRTRPRWCASRSTGRAPTSSPARGTAVLGQPAQPIVHDGEVFAAWLGQGKDGGVLWSSRDGPSPLDYGGGDARRSAAPGLRRERARRHPQRDAIRVGLDGARRRARSPRARTGRSMTGSNQRCRAQR